MKTVIILIALAFLFAMASSAVQAASPQFYSDSGEDEKENQTDLEKLERELNELRMRLKDSGKAREGIKSNQEQLRNIVINNNEAATLENLTNIFKACQLFKNNRELATFPRKFSELDGYISGKILEAASPEQACYGYYYQYSYINKDRFSLRAMPAFKDRTGRRTFYLDQDGQILDDQTREIVADINSE